MMNEMNLMKMDERQRLAWFMANRGTLIAVGAVWVAMIGWELTHGRTPTFLLVMVPVFALFRAGLYFIYGAGSFAGNESQKAGNFVRYGKMLAAFLLFIAAFLPLYSITGIPGEAERTKYTWNLIQDDSAAIVPLIITFLWPFIFLGLARIKSQRFLSALIQYAEPFFVVVSSVIVLWIPQLVFETTTLFFILIVPVNPVPGWGCYLAVVANGLYLVSWLAGLLQPWNIQEE